MGAGMATDTFVALGDPTQIDFASYTPPERPVAVPTATEVSQSEAVGVPFQNRVETEPVAEEEDLLSRRDVEDQLGLDELQEVDDTFELWSPATWFRRPSVILILASLGALVLLFVFSEVVSLFGEIHNLPHLVQPAAYLLVALLAGVVVLSLSRLVWKYAQLQASPRVSVAALGTLRERAVLRRAALEGLSAAQTT